MTSTTAPTPTAAGTGPVGVGIIGAGVIAGTYLENLKSFPDVVVHAVGDLYPEAAATRANEYGVDVHGGVDVVLEHPDVEIVINLTVPVAHAEVALAAIAAGKHAYNEKPLSLDLASATQLLEAATAAGLRVGCAPDTFLGEGLQTALRMIRRGDIGTPLTGLTLMQSPGPESWHPNPAFLFQEGAGPLFDIGPYYLPTLVPGVRSSDQRGGSLLQGAGDPDDRFGPQGGRGVRRHGAQSPRLDHDVRQRRLGSEHLLLRLPAAPRGLGGDHRVRGDPVADRPEHLRRNDQDPPPRWRRLGGGGRDHRAVRARGPVCWRWLARSERAPRTGPAASWPTTCLDLMVSTSASAQQQQFVPIQSGYAPTDVLPDDWDPKAATL